MVANVRTPGPENLTELRCLACRHVLGAYETREEILKTLVSHYMDEHGELGELTVLVEADSLDGSGHYAVYPAPWRCDLCSSPVEPPWWEYVTPPTPTYRVQDPAWLVCERCHANLEHHNMLPIIRRAMKLHQETYGIPYDVMREVSTGFISDFIRHIDPAQTKREAA